LGFKASTARQAVEAVYQPGEEVSTEELIKRALRGPEDR
jgi:Holliday junction resolvasome RuvABC DNA-binding subunit